MDPRVKNIPWRRDGNPLFLIGKSHGQRNLAGYSSWGRKESDSIVSERLSLVHPELSALEKLVQVLEERCRRQEKEPEKCLS